MKKLVDRCKKSSSIFKFVRLLNLCRSFFPGRSGFLGSLSPSWEYGVWIKKEIAGLGLWNTSTLKLEYQLIWKGIYEHRSSVWDSLSATISSFFGPLLLCGNFNQVLSPVDKWGENNLHTPGSLPFQSFLNSFGLVEVKNVGPRFTWTNNREGDACIFERLDRDWCNLQWLDKFPKAYMSNLGIYRSDHAVISFVTSPLHLFPLSLLNLRLGGFKTQQVWNHWFHLEYASSWFSSF